MISEEDLQKHGHKTFPELRKEFEDARKMRRSARTKLHAMVMALQVIDEIWRQLKTGVHVNNINISAIADVNGVSGIRRSDFPDILQMEHRPTLTDAYMIKRRYNDRMNKTRESKIEEPEQGVLPMEGTSETVEETEKILVPSPEDWFMDCQAVRDIRNGIDWLKKYGCVKDIEIVIRL